MADRRARLGIDFGTANTVAVLALPGRDPRPLLFDGSPLLPSAVCADVSGRLLVGRDAIHTATTHPASFEPHPKRCIDDGTVLLGERDIAVTDLIGAVLRRVTGEATQVAGAPPGEAVLTYPAAWGTSRRDTLLAAASTALPTVRLVAEPAAAASHFAASTDQLPIGGTALVYDFGAGTFDASVVRRTDGGFDILASHGLPDCGGLDLDAAAVAYLGAVLRERDPTAWTRLSSPQAPADRRAARQLWDNVRTAKEMLSRSTSTVVHVPLLDVDAPLGRAQLEEMAGPILERTIKASKAALRDAGVDPGELAAVFLAGGSSRMPAVATAVHRALGIAPTLIDQPELATAEGSIQTAPARPGAAGGTAAAGSYDASWPPAVTVPIGPAPAGAATTGLARSWLGAPGSVRRRRLAIAASTLTVLAIISTLTAQLGDPSEGSGSGSGRSPAAGIVPTKPSASPKPTYAPGVDPCMVGTWRRVNKNKYIELYGEKVQFVGRGGQVDTYRANGTVTVKWSDSTSATHKGVRWKETTNGTINARYRTSNGTLIYSNPKGTGTWKLFRNGSVNNSAKLTISLEPERYVCTATSFTTAASFYSLEFVRVVPATTPPVTATPG